MTLLTIQFKATQVEVDDTVKNYIEEKFQAFDKFIQDETDVKCQVEFSRVNPQQTGDIYRVEGNVWLAGKLYRAEATAISFEVAGDMVRQEIEKEMRRAHKKRNSLFKRGGRRIKEMMRWGK
jgi:ribosomal subunit interface protein